MKNTIQLDATTIASASLPLWANKNFFSEKEDEYLLKTQEFICLERLLNHVVLNDEIFVPNLEALLDSSHYAKRLMIRSPNFGEYSCTFEEEAFGIVTYSISKLLNERIIVGENCFKEEYYKPLEQSVFRLANDLDFQEQVLKQISEYKDTVTLAGLKSIWGCTAPVNPLQFSFTDAIDFPHFELIARSIPFKIAANDLICEAQEPDTDWMHGEALVWISLFLLRGILYEEIAKIKNIHYSPHPLRLSQSLAYTSWALGRSDNYIYVPLQILKNIRKTLIEYCSEPISSLFEIDIPPLMAIILKSSKYREELIDKALELRNSENGKGIRELYSTILKSNNIGDGKTLIKLESEIQKISQSIAKEYNLSTETVSAKVFLFSFNLKLPPFLFRSYYVSTRYTQALYDLSKVLLSIKSSSHDIKRLFTTK